MSRFELKTYPVEERYTQLALLYDHSHWTWFDEKSARAGLAYDPTRGELKWWARERSGSSGESVAVPFIAISSMASDELDVAEELRKVTERAKARARKRIRELEADGTSDALRVASRLKKAVSDDWLRTRPRAPNTKRGRKRY